MMLNVPHIFLLWSYRLRRRDQERRRAAELVAAKEAELRDMFERSPVSVVIASVDGEFRFANSSWLKLMKLEQEELGRHHIWKPISTPRIGSRCFRKWRSAARFAIAKCATGAATAKPSGPC